MSQQTGDDGSIDYSNLFVYAGPEEAALSDMTVYERGQFDVGPYRIHAWIIGSSHYIRVPELGYYELTSCRPVDMVKDFDPILQHYDITEGISQAIDRHVGDRDVRISILTLGDVDIQPDAWDVCYTFEGDGPSAPTAIRAREDGWETVHSYPEYDTSVWTITEIGGIE